MANEPLSIPDDCKRVKDIFLTWPDDDIVREIVAHIKEIGAPHLWRGHTHTHPPDSAEVRYLTDFELTDAQVTAQGLAPCPCCTPNFPKYRRGYVAWFPDERVIRLVGRDCFRALSPDAHDAAVKELDASRKRKADAVYLLANLPQLPNWLALLRKALIVAEAFDAAHATLHSKTGFAADVWRNVRPEGVMKVERFEEQTTVGRDGAQRTARTPVSVRYGQLPGFQATQPGKPDSVTRLTRAIETFERFLTDGSVENAIDTMSEQERADMVAKIGRRISSANSAIAKLADARRFFEPVAINTLRGWIAAQGSPLSYHVEIRGGVLRFGRNEHQAATVRIAPELHESLEAIHLAKPT